MSFLTPWFLLGALAIAGPILFHLIRRASRERLRFSSIMFLRPTPPKVTRRQRIENPWLLLLRCLVLLLLAAGFARPFFANNVAIPAAGMEGRQLILLLDTSASMRRDGMWEKARSIAENYLDKASAADEIAVQTFDRQPRVLVNFTEWSSWSVDQRSALARQRLATVAPGWMGTQLGLALTSAAEQFERGPANKNRSRQEIVVITDLQEGAKLDGLQGHDWPVGVNVIVEIVSATARGNAGLEIAQEGTSDGPVPVRVTNARDSGVEKFGLSWSGDPSAGSKTEEIYLVPGQTRTFASPEIPKGATRLRLTGDEASFDNETFYAAPEKEIVQIAYLGSDAGNDPKQLRYYLERVFSQSAGREVRVRSPGNFDEVLNQSAFAVVPGSLSAPEVAAVRAWMSQGKTALLILSDTKMGSILEGLAGVPVAPLVEAGGDYALLGEIDFKHPIFAPFSDPRFSDFTSIHFWKHRRWEVPSGGQASVLARFDDGSPALVEMPVGGGHLLVLTSGWHPADSQLALASKFPPLIQTMLEWSGATASARFQFQTGDAIPSPLAAGSAMVEWEKPDGKKEALAAGVAFVGTDKPGIYMARFGGKERRVAVNLSLEESRTTPTSPAELARRGVPMKSDVKISAAQSEKRVERLKQGEVENRQKLWRWLIVGVLVVTLGEIILSGWLTRRALRSEALA